MEPNRGAPAAGRMYADLAYFVFAKRKAVEHTGADGNVLKIEVSRVSFPDETAAQLPPAQRILTIEDAPEEGTG
jgi:hypothetical protein